MILQTCKFEIVAQLQRYLHYIKDKNLEDYNNILSFRVDALCKTWHVIVICVAPSGGRSDFFILFPKIMDLFYSICHSLANYALFLSPWDENPGTQNSILQLFSAMNETINFSFR